MMTTNPTAQSGVGSDPETPQDGADDEPSKRKSAICRVAVAVPLVLLALGAGAFVALIRTRSDHSSEKSMRPGQAPLSVFRIAAAPHSVVHIVSGPSLGRSHLQIPTKVSG